MKTIFLILIVTNVIATSRKTCGDENNILNTITKDGYEKVSTYEYSDTSYESSEELPKVGGSNIRYRHVESLFSKYSKPRFTCNPNQSSITANQGSDADYKLDHELDLMSDGFESLHSRDFDFEDDIFEGQYVIGFFNCLKCEHRIENGLQFKGFCEPCHQKYRFCPRCSKKDKLKKVLIVAKGLCGSCYETAREKRIKETFKGKYFDVFKCEMCYNSFENALQFNGFCGPCHEKYRCCKQCLKKDNQKKEPIVAKGLCKSCYKTALAEKKKESFEGEFVAVFECEMCHNSIQNGLQFKGFCQHCHEKHRCCPQCLKKDPKEQRLIVAKGLCEPCYKTAHKKRKKESCEGEYVAVFECEMCHNSIENGLQIKGFCQQCHEKHRCCPQCLKKDPTEQRLIVAKGLCESCYDKRRLIAGKLYKGLFGSCYKTTQKKRTKESFEGEHVAVFKCENCHHSIENGLQYNGFCEPCHEKYRCCKQCLKKDPKEQRLILAKELCKSCYKIALAEKKKGEFVAVFKCEKCRNSIQNGLQYKGFCQQCHEKHRCCPQCLKKDPKEQRLIVAKGLCESCYATAQKKRKKESCEGEYVAVFKCEKCNSSIQNGLQIKGFCEPCHEKHRCCPQCLKKDPKEQRLIAEKGLCESCYRTAQKKSFKGEYVAVFKCEMCHHSIENGLQFKGFCQKCHEKHRCCPQCLKKDSPKQRLIVAKGLCGSCYRTALAERKKEE